MVWNLGNLAKEQSVSFTLVVDVKSPTKTLVNQAITKSSVWDVFPANSQDQVSVQAIDDVHPTAIWRLPVGAEGILQVYNRNVLLEVEAADNVAVAYVRFYRWDPVLFQTLWKLGTIIRQARASTTPAMNATSGTWIPVFSVRSGMRSGYGHTMPRATLLPDGYRILLKYLWRTDLLTHC